MGRGECTVRFDEVERFSVGLEPIDENGITHRQRLLLDLVTGELHDAANVVNDGHDRERLRRMLREQELLRFLTREEQSPLATEFWHWLYEVSLLKELHRSSYVAFTTLDMALGLYPLGGTMSEEMREREKNLRARVLEVVRLNLRQPLSPHPTIDTIESYTSVIYSHRARAQAADAFLLLDPAERFERLFKRPETTRYSDLEGVYRFGEEIERRCDPASLVWPKQLEMTYLLAGLLEMCRNDRWFELFSRAAGRIGAELCPEAARSFLGSDPAPAMEPTHPASESIGFVREEAEEHLLHPLTRR